MEQPHELPPGTTFGQYTIDALIGAGGMGQVYRATDRRLKRTVAIKVLTPALAHDAGFAARFEREALLLASLNHPNIAAIYGMESSGAIEGLVLEFVEGKTVADRLASGPMAIAEALVVARQIALALEAAHDQGIVHRDLKPANVKITTNGLVKVLDFGLARAAFDSPEALTFAPTQAGVILGTPAYMSPEQARGQAVDKRTDIWSFGCVLYEMLAGHGAFSAGTASDSLVKLLERAPDWTALPANVPDPIRRLVARCLDKNPANRLHDIADARIEIAAVEASPAGDTTHVEASARPAGNRRFMRVAAIALVAAAIGAGVSWTLFRDHPMTDLVLRRLTVDSSLTTDQAISRDGRLIAYASDRGGANLDIWVQQVAGGTAVQITNDPADDVEPTFSPDGSQLAFRSDRDGGGIYLVSTLGGSARRIADRGRRPRWSPDGKYIAYWTGLDTAFLMTQADGPRTFIVSASGGEPRAIAANLSTAWSPVWSADSTALLLLGSRDMGTAPDWCVASLDGAAVLTTNANAAIRKPGLVPSPDAFFTPEAWTADGHVLFSARLGDSTNIWQLAVGSDGAISAAPVRLTSGANVETAPAVDDESRLAYSVLTSNVDLWSLPVDTMLAKATGAMTRLTDDSAMDAFPWLTPDGSKLTFMSNRSGNYDLWLREMATGKETTLAAHVVFPGVPITSKDGSHVIVESAVDRHLFSLPLSGIGAGPSAVRMCDDCNPWDVSADGKWTLDSTPEDTLIRAREVASGKTTTFLQARSGEIVGRLRISPDDKWVAFTHRSGGGIQQNVVPFRPGGLVPEAEWIPVTPADSAAAIATWSPDSRMVYYFSDRDGHVCLWAQPIDTVTGHPSGDAIDVWHFHEARHSLGRIALPLRGMTMVRDRIVLSLAESTSAVWLAAPGGARP